MYMHNVNVCMHVCMYVCIYIHWICIICYSCTCNTGMSDLHDMYICMNPRVAGPLVSAYISGESQVHVYQLSHM